MMLAAHSGSGVARCEQRCSHRPQRTHSTVVVVAQQQQPPPHQQQLHSRRRLLLAGGAASLAVVVLQPRPTLARTEPLNHEVDAAQSPYIQGVRVLLVAWPQLQQHPVARSCRLTTATRVLADRLAPRLLSLNHRCCRAAAAQ
jgi:hypothetical protein